MANNVLIKSENLGHHTCPKNIAHDFISPVKILVVFWQHCIGISLQDKWRLELLFFFKFISIRHISTLTYVQSI